MTTIQIEKQNFYTFNLSEKKLGKISLNVKHL